VDRDLMGYYLAFSRAVAAQIVLVAAAGNDDVDSLEENVYPCALPYTICIGALGSTAPGNVHVWDHGAVDYSNHGAAVDLWAPTMIDSWYGTGAVPDLDWYSGTSAAAPFVSGVVAMMKSVAPTLSVAQVLDILLETAWTDSPDSKVDRSLNAYEAVRRAAGHSLPADRFEPNDSGAAARALSEGLHQNLSIHRGNDADFYRTSVAGPTLATIDVTYPRRLGTMSLPPFGRETTQSCGLTEQVAYDRRDDGLTATYRLATGSFVFAATSPGNPLAYHLDLDLSGAPVAPDAFEPNNSFAAARNVHSGYVSGTLHGLSDVDFYRVYSEGSFSTIVLSMQSRANVETSDIPLTLELFNSAGVSLGVASSSADCRTQASLAMPQGFHTVKVSGPGIGAYRLWLGSYGVQHPIVDIEKWIYLILNPNEPVELILREPDAWVVLHHNSDYPLDALELTGAGLHLRLFDERGEQLIAEGVPNETLTGETLSVPFAQTNDLMLLHVTRTAPALAGAELPVIPATLVSRD
jgi:hypothetical protein